MNNFFARSLTGIVFAALIICSVVFSNFIYLIVFGFFTSVGTWEFYRMVSKSDIVVPLKLPGILASLISFAFLGLAISFDLPIAALVIVLILLLLISIMELYRKSSNPVLNISATLFPVIYIALPFALGTSLFTPEFDPSFLYLLGFFIILWTNDSMAYVVGMLIGKNRLFERISPKKSWEGFIGGLIFSVIIALLIAYFYQPNHLLQWIGFGVTISITATFGDLVESMLKRSFNVKDSGSILPGHGGVLDRFDGAIMALPFAVAYHAFFFTSLF